MDEFLGSNRELWDEWTEVHESSEFYDLRSFREGGVRLRDYEIEQVGDVQGKTLLHLQCHFGIDSLSWAASAPPSRAPTSPPRRSTLATRLAADLGLDARFVESNVYDLPERLEGSFDVVYTSRGRAGLAPRHPRLGARRRALREARRHLLHHRSAPDRVGAGRTNCRSRSGTPIGSTPSPIASDVEGSYADVSADVKSEKEYSWQHGLGEIVTALIDAGLTIELLREYPFSAWDMGFTVEGPDDTWVKPDSVEGELPLFYSLRARKPGERSTGVREPTLPAPIAPPVVPRGGRRSRGS